MKEEQFEITEATCTCGVFPFQLECKTKCGRMVYIRYRHSGLSINVTKEKSEDINDAVAGETAEELFYEDLNNSECISDESPDDSYSKMLDYLKSQGFNKLKFPEKLTAVDILG